MTKFVFAPNCFFSFPKGSGGLKTPKLTPGSPLEVPFWAILWAFWAILVPKNAFFSKIFLCPNDIFRLPTWSGTIENPKVDLCVPQRGYYLNIRTHWTAQWRQKWSQNGPKWPQKGFSAPLGPCTCQLTLMGSASPSLMAPTVTRQKPAVHKP